MRFALAASAVLLIAADAPPEQPVPPYTQSDANADATPMAGDATFRAFHGVDGLRRISARLVALNRADPRIKEIFASTDDARLTRTLAEQFCYILNGGCHYTGRDMKTVHKDMGIQNADMGALVENLERAMEEEKVPFWAQARLLAKLAPQKRRIVER